MRGEATAANATRTTDCGGHAAELAADSRSGKRQSEARRPENLVGLGKTPAQSFVQFSSVW